MSVPEGIDADDLDSDGDLLLLNGVPYSGPAYTRYRNGAIETQSAYKDGFREGLCREWYSSGGLMREWTAVRGCAEGTVKEWHKNGQLKSIASYVLGIRESCMEWDELGNAAACDDRIPSALQMEQIRLAKERQRSQK